LDRATRHLEIRHSPLILCTSAVKHFSGLLFDFTNFGSGLFMANCSKCGRQMSGFSFGKRKSVCKWCVQYEAAQRGEAPEDDAQPIMTAPWERSVSDSMFFTQLILLMNVLVFVAMGVAGISLTDPSSPELIRWGANYGPLTLGGQPWRLITCVFLHIGIIHIALNMWCLWTLGEMAEKLYGHVTFLFVYLTTGIAASLTSVWWSPGGVSAGASGAIFGVAGALIASYYLGDFSLPQTVVKASLRSVVTFAGYNLVFGMMSGRIDNSAHIGGLISGLALGAVIAKVAPETENWGSRLMVSVLGLGLVVGATVWLQRAKVFEIHTRNGEVAFGDRKYDESIKEFQEAVKARPNDVSAKLRLANAYTANKQFDKSIAELRRALLLDPKNESIAYEVGAVYVDAEQNDNAKQEFDRMLSTNPKSAYAHYGKGLIAYDEGDSQTAINEFSGAVELDPKFTQTYYFIGAAQAKLAKYDDAIESMKKSVRLNGDNADTELALADLYRTKGMAKEAQEAMAKAAKLKAAEEEDTE
jgi:rhomboid protease GluP